MGPRPAEPRPDGRRARQEPDRVDPLGRRRVAAGRRRRQGLGRRDQRHPAVRAGPQQAEDPDHLRRGRRPRPQQPRRRDDGAPPDRPRRDLRPVAGRAAGPHDRERRPRHRRDVGLRPRARHRARPALGALLRALRRGPGADRRDGRRHHPRPAGPQPGEPDLGGRHGQALRRLLGARQRLRPHRRHHRRQRAAEHPPAVVRAGHRRRRRDRDGQQRLGQRRARPRLAPHAHRHPARPAALQGRRDLRLAGRREPDHQVPRRHRHGGRDLAGRQRGPRHVDDPARRRTTASSPT